MKCNTAKNIVAGLAAVTACFVTKTTFAQTSNEVRLAFVNLHDDTKKHNCGEAVAWLYSRRDQFKDDLVDELYRTDAQGATAIMYLLFNTRSFKPDERFINTVMASLGRSSRAYIGGGIAYDLPPREAGQARGTWEYVDAHFDTFEPLLTQQIGTTSDPWILWAIAWEFKSRNILEQKIDLFTLEVMKKAAANLVNDNIGWNASQTVRLFLVLGDRTVPILKEAAQSPDSQARNFARATLDALKGNRRAFGYLNSKVDLTQGLLTLPGAKDYQTPEWLSDETEPYLFNDRPYP